MRSFLDVYIKIIVPAKTALGKNNKANQVFVEHLTVFVRSVTSVALICIGLKPQVHNSFIEITCAFGALL